MSRIGNKIIKLPAGVTVSRSDNNVVVKGPKGELSQPIDPDFKLEQEGEELKVLRPTEQKRHKALHGLYRSLVNNAVVGVSEGYKKELELVGVGYKATNQGNVLDLSLGYSHNIIFVVPEELKVTTEMVKGQNPKVILEGSDKQLIGLVAAKLRELRKIEPYKGKGVRFTGEQIRRKAGKTAAK
ncbi:50S ribosomal protein L6 [Jiulongibacter sediminis]|uniref:Large ribosomal subunit protein uL6 n=1 Tax=Jiulongibacter sediminis TaxID=1605367 RepID=A0A0P7C8G4_9BACT|nr:50S ribosomal protein L6 [Jiulongibacter sediminis]KPM49872.1 50S ribosomal protein L6 [Jiulongibacter sediminis]TBX26908.1 50S ribosomal protein L6 [Jiulongibacter sediminis]